MITKSAIERSFDLQLQSFSSFIPRHGHRAVSEKEKRKLLMNAAKERIYAGKIPLSHYELLLRNKDQIVEWVYRHQTEECEVPFLIVFNVETETLLAVAAAHASKEARKDLLEGCIHERSSSLQSAVHIIVGAHTTLGYDAPEKLVVKEPGWYGTVHDCLTLCCHGYAPYKGDRLVAAGSTYDRPKERHRHPGEPRNIPVVDLSADSISLTFTKENSEIEAQYLRYRHRISLTADEGMLIETETNAST